MTTELLAAALEAYDAGLCTIRPRSDGTKAPMAVPHHGRLNSSTGKREPGWELYQLERPSRHTVEAWFATSPGLGVVCGTVSGHLQMLELEGRALTDEIRRRRFIEALDRHGARQTWDRMTAGYLESTPSGGVHTMAYVPGHVAGNVVFARCLDDDGTARPLIETRGDGGFVVVAPSNGTTHPTGGSWTLRAGGFGSIATLTAEEWDLVATAAMECNELDSPDPTIPQPERRTTAQPWQGGTVGSSWANVAAAHLQATDGTVAILERHGWTVWRETDELVYVTRPGKDGGVSGHVKRANGRLLNYSSSAPFQAWPTFVDGQRVPTTTYDAGDVLAVYEHGGDRMAALRAVAEATGILAAWRAERDAESRAVVELADLVADGSSCPPPHIDAETGEISQPLNLPDTFWTERPILERIRAAAWSRMVSPDAVLANEIARTATLVPPRFRLPDVIGAEATLDFIGCVVADTSGGKSIAHGVARRLIPEPDHDPDDDSSWQIMMDLPIGSGEGIAQAFMVPEYAEDDNGKRTTTGRQVVGRQALHLVVDEGTAFVNQAERNGTTIVATLASAWSGQALGNLNASKETRRLIAGGRVRVTAVVNMQAENGHMLFTPQLESVGLTGRILFASAHDPAAPAEELPKWPGELTWPALSVIDQASGTFRYADEIVTEIRAERHGVLTRRKAINKRRSQVLLLRCKVAAVLAYWEGRLDVTVDDWRLAGQILETSGAVLRHLEDVKRLHDLNEDNRRAHARGIGDAIAETAKERRLIAELSTRIVARVPDEGIGRGVLERALTSKATRHRFEPALELAVANGYLTVADGRITKAPT